MAHKYHGGDILYLKSELQTLIPDLLRDFEKSRIVN